jgi:hypothetical protein
VDQGEAGTARDSPPARRHLWRGLAVALVGAVFVAAIFVVVRQPSSTTAARPARVSRPTSFLGPLGALAPRPLAPSTDAGPVGVEASWVVAENDLPGTTSWIIPPATPTGIEGFSNRNYAAVGDSVNLYVSTTAQSYHVVAYRMGWYGGKGARQIWVSGQATGGVQPACPVTPGINMVSCDNWQPSLSFPVTTAFVQGDYLLKLVGSGGQEGYVPLTVWSPPSTATYLVINRSFTEEGWNTYGGYSFYQGKGPCALDSNSYPVCNRARVVSFDRPFDTGDGAADFLGDEFPLIQYCERHGLDVTYVTDVTLDADPQIALHHKVLLSLGHDESWSYNEREAAQTAQEHGVNIVFFGAAAVLRNVRLQPSALGPDREEVDYRDSSEDPLDGHGNPLEVTGNTWSSSPASWSEIPFVGELYSGYLSGSDSVPFVVYDAAAWPFAHTGLRNGSQLPGVIMSDVDHLGPGVSTPEDLQVLGHSPIPVSEAYTNQGTWSGLTYSDMTYYTDPKSGAGVLDTGTVNWIAAMQQCPPATADCPAGTVRTITGNVLRLFGRGPAGATTPSVANWRTVVPPGS